MLVANQWFMQYSVYGTASTFLSFSWVYIGSTTTACWSLLPTPWSSHDQNHQKFHSQRSPIRTAATSSIPSLQHALCCMPRHPMLAVPPPSLSLSLSECLYLFSLSHLHLSLCVIRLCVCVCVKLSVSVCVRCHNWHTMMLVTT